MSTLILLSVKLGLAMSGFLGAAKVMEWYNTSKEKGGKPNGFKN